MNLKKYKVLHVFASLDMGGAESRIMDVFRCIDKTIFSFDFLTMSLNPQYYEDEIKALGGTVIKIDSPRNVGVFANYRQMLHIMKSGQYDVIHTHTSFHGVLAAYAAKKAKVPIRIVHSRTASSGNRSILNKLGLRAARLLIPRFANYRLAISQEAGAYLFGKHSFTVLPNAIDVKKYQNITDDQCEALRQEFNLAAAHPIIGMVGRFNAMKNHQFALYWFKHFLQDHPDAILVLIGDAAYQKIDVKALAHELNIQNSVRFAGVRSDVNEWMSVFDVVIMPSIFEGLGGVILEAQAAGCPVVKSDSFTNEADMDIGLVQEVSLQSSLMEWNKAVEKALTTNPQPVDSINKAFDLRGYSLEHEIEILTDIYKK